jgi:hypothetical protein
VVAANSRAIAIHPSALPVRVALPTLIA